MIYSSAQAWRDDRHKRVLLFGMSGLGKTHVSKMLSASGDWFHYSVDYRIASHYMRDQIGRDISFDDLEPLASYLGKPGDPALGGLEFSEYMRRQDIHMQAETSTLLDAAPFITKARKDFHADHFICDSGGSICEVVDPHDRDSHLLKSLSENLLMVWIKGTEAHNARLIRRFDAAPKPMCYRPEFTRQRWQEFLHNNNALPNRVDPDTFVRSAYERALSERQPIYAAMAENWGVTVSAEDVAKATTPQAFTAMIAAALEKHYSQAYPCPSSNPDL